MGDAVRNRKNRLLEAFETGSVLRIGSTVYLIICSVVILAVSIFIPLHITSSDKASNSFSAIFDSLTPIVLIILNIVALGFILLLRRKCNHCRTGPAQRILTAVDKMRKGDLGWKLTLRGGDELYNVADSISQASMTLGDRISRLQVRTKELSAVEDFLIDSIETNRNLNPHTLKALRNLKICTNRLKSDVDDFHVSSLANSNQKPSNSN